MLPHDLLDPHLAQRRPQRADRRRAAPASRARAADALAGRPGTCRRSTAPEYVLIPDIEDSRVSSRALPQNAASSASARFLGIPLRLEGGTSAGCSSSRADAEPVLRGRRRRGPPRRRPREPRALAPAPGRGGAARRRGARARDAARGARRGAHATELETTRGYRRVVGESKSWKDVLTQAAKVAPTETTVLLTGESGTGKEVVARFIHRGSPRARGPFVGAQLRRAAGDAARVGAVRPREGRLHRRDVGARPGASSRPRAACSSSTRSAR